LSTCSRLARHSSSCSRRRAHGARRAPPRSRCPRSAARSRRQHGP
jgi:hypothetical protein